MAKFQGYVRDPFQAFRFRVSIATGGAQGADHGSKQGSDAIAGFQTVSGLREETEVTEYREGNDPSTMRKLPGLTSFDNITLEKGVALDAFFRIWRNEIYEAARGLDGVMAPNLSMGGSGAGAFRADLDIDLFEKGTNFAFASARWAVKDAWPNSLEYGDFDATSSDVLLETLELAHEGCTRILNLPRG
jgi:phage tail-like protein